MANAYRGKPTTKTKCRYQLCINSLFIIVHDRYSLVCEKNYLYIVVPTLIETKTEELKIFFIFYFLPKRRLIVGLIWGGGERRQEWERDGAC